MFFFAVVFCQTVFGQYPKDEIVDPYPLPIKERILVKRFECNAAEMPSWHALHQAKISAHGDDLRIESSGSDPYVMLPEFADKEAGAFEFRIRMKNGMAPKAEIFWATSARPNFNAENAIRFNFVQDEWNVASAMFETDSPLNRLRFDPGASEGSAEIEWIELYKIVYGEKKESPTPWFDPNWADKVEKWAEISSENVSVRFDEKGSGAQIFFDKEHVGDIYPLGYFNPDLPVRGDTGPTGSRLSGIMPNQVFFIPVSTTKTDILLEEPVPPDHVVDFNRKLKFAVKENEIRFEVVRATLSSDDSFSGPVFRPKGEMQQAVLCGVEYLEKGEHSSSTADLETKEHLRFAPKPLDITWPFMSIVTDKIGFGLLWDDPPQSRGAQAVFATPDFIFGDPDGHHMGLYGEQFSGTLKISPSKRRGRQSPNDLNGLEELILWGIQEHGLPELPRRFRNDEEQRLLNLAAFEKSLAAGSTGWQHAATPGVEKQYFPMNYGNDFVSVIWQLSGKLPEVPRLDHGGGHLRNPASFFLMGKTNEFLDWTRNETRHLIEQQKEDGSFRYAGKYLRGHWEDTASGHCGNALYRLMYNYRILGDGGILTAVRKGLDFANKYPTPRGAQVWELSIHTPDIMGSSRMCMANVWFYEATGEEKYLDAARRWAVTGLPFVYFWTSEKIRKPAPGAPEVVMEYATIPVFGATNWQAPNWIGLPVQWCGLDYGEALFMLSEHDKTIDWRKVAEGILIAGERMQYPDGMCVGLLPDSLVLDSQTRNPHDINPSVLVMQRRRIQGELPDVDVALDSGGKFRVVSPFKTKIETDPEGKTRAFIEGEVGTTYQILVNGKDIKSIESKGADKIELP